MDSLALASSIKSLERSADSLSGWLTFFTALVVIGLILEYRKDVTGIFRSFEWPKLGAVIGGILVTVGVAGELFIGFRASTVETKLRSANAETFASLNKEAGAARKAGADISAKYKDVDLAIADANARVKAAEARIAEANQQAEEEKLARVKIEAQIAPRRLKGTQKDILVKWLRDARDARSPIVIVSKILDSESSDFADDFDSAFKAAGWETLRIRNHISSRYGVAVGVTAATPVLPLVGKLRDALRTIGVPNEDSSFTDGDASASPPFQARVLYLVVGQKPPPIVRPTASKQ